MVRHSRVRAQHDPAGVPSFCTSEAVLTKWYLDCVDDAGDVAIAYSARFAWMHVSLSYASILVNRGGETRCRELFTDAEPHRDADRLLWFADRLGVRAQLDRRAPAYDDELMDGVEWHCLMPSADARFELDDGDPIEGRGYAEILELRIAPWKLPIDELRWGRFAGDTSVTWIDWRGDRPLTTVVVDGARVTDGCVEDDRITAGGLTLTVGRDRVIRDEPIGGRLKSVLPMLPSRILGARETKWCGRAALAGNAVAGRGWAVHEIVRFA